MNGPCCSIPVLIIGGSKKISMRLDNVFGKYEHPSKHETSTQCSCLLLGQLSWKETK